MAETTITLTIDTKLKNDCEEIFRYLGMDINTAFNIFMHQVYNYGGMPFDIKRPNMDLDKLIAVRECEDILSGKLSSVSYSSVEELFADLDSEDEGDEV